MNNLKELKIAVTVEAAVAAIIEKNAPEIAKANAELDRLRAELAVAKNWVEHHSKHADDLIAENVKLRADLERFTGHGLLDCHAICDQRDAAVARAERAEAALAEWSVLNLWGGTPEIIHEFIKGQQHRIHYCQNLETELESLRAEVERLRSDRDCEKRLRKDADEFRENAIARAERAEAELHDVSLDLSTANHMIKLERDRADALQTRLNEIESALRKFNLID